MISKNKIKIAVVGLGYVGLPLAVEFSKKFPVIGFDLNKDRTDELNQGKDYTNEVSKDVILGCKNLNFVNQPSKLSCANVFIITVPTPVDEGKSPNLEPLISASKTVAGFLKIGSVVIYESTVYPGCTEEICVPILEKYSSYSYNKDFFCGYSPERINPGDKKHTLPHITKITSGSNKDAAKFVNSLYQNIIKAGTYSAKSISVAEAAKVIENTQRDVNIALINEFAMIFNKLGLDTNDILDAAGTKWNFLRFRPGLVGGHCIGVDPYYLSHKALEVGYHPEIILSGRRINDSMSQYIVEKTLMELSKKGISPLGAKIAVLGVTFKENCPDLRNSKAFDIISQLKKFKCNLSISDEIASAVEVDKKFGIHMKSINQISNQDAVIISVGHKGYTKFLKRDWDRILQPNGVFIDVKSLYSLYEFKGSNVSHWRL